MAQGLKVDEHGLCSFKASYQITGPNVSERARSKVQALLKEGADADDAALVPIDVYGFVREVDDSNKLMVLYVTWVVVKPHAGRAQQAGVRQVSKVLKEVML